ncbi:MAG TPA: hypothetical protein PKC69_15670 [Chitinophagaceae bacterium]|nr:hypothetical protein [Chitinophagaceae bacterium]
MLKKLIFLLSFIFLKDCTYAQAFNSVHVYILNLKSFYTIKIDKDIIKNETAPFLVSNPKAAGSIFRILTDDIRGKAIGHANDYAEIRLLVEFFLEGKLSRFISLTSDKLIYSDGKLFECSNEDLIKLNSYIDRLTIRLGY